MATVIRRYSEDLVAGVRDFNRRLLAGGAPGDLVFPEHPVPVWLPKLNGARIYNEYFLALEGDAVRGAYVRKRQECSFGGAVRPVDYYHHALSEGFVDKGYATVGVQLLRHALKNEPVMYALGMEAYDRPLPRMLQAMGWSHFLVPFYFRVLRPARFFRHMQFLRGTAGRRLAMDAAAWSGAGWLAIQTVQRVRSLRGPRRRRVGVVEVSEFSDWADRLWERSRARYSMTAVRDAASLRTLYPAENRRFTRLKVSRDGEAIGWAVVAEQNRKPRYGDMRVGCVLDGFAEPEDAIPVVQAATRALERSGMDLIVSNQSHAAWGDAFRRSGFLAGPSNFIFAASKALTAILEPLEQNRPRMHITRADGDGLYQYL
jgi:hypothetical protein